MKIGEAIMQISKNKHISFRSDHHRLYYYLQWKEIVLYNEKGMKFEDPMRLCHLARMWDKEGETKHVTMDTGYAINHILENKQDTFVSGGNRLYYCHYDNTIMLYDEVNMEFKNPMKVEFIGKIWGLRKNWKEGYD